MNRDQKIADLTNMFIELKRSMHKRLEDGPYRWSVTPAQAEILIRIARGETRTADLATAMYASPSAVTQHINQLAEAGLVHKTVSPYDRREVVLSLTPTAKRVIQSRQKLLRQRVEKIVGILDDQELEQLVTIINKIITHS